MLDDALQHALNYAERVKCTTLPYEKNRWVTDFM